MKKLSVKGRLRKKAVAQTSVKKPATLCVADEAMCRSLFENMTYGLAYFKVLFDEAGKPEDYVFLEVNDAYERIMGQRRSEVVGRKATEILPGIERDPVFGVYTQVAESGKGVSFDIYHESLKQWHSVTAYSPEKGYFAVVFDDVTERKRAEETIRHLASFPQYNPNPVIEVDASGNIAFCNPAASESLAGLGLDKAGPKLFLPQDIKAILKGLGQNKAQTLHREINIGNKVFAESIYVAPQFHAVRIYARDITERKRTEKELQKYRHNLEELVTAKTTELKDRTDLLDAFFEHTITPMAVLDRDFNFIIVNTAYAMAGSRDVSDYPGKNHFALYPSDAKDIFDEVVRSKNPYITFARPFEYADRPEWGVTYWDWALVPVLDEAQEVKYLVFTLRDVTEQKKAEEQLRQSQKMEALGQLAGGIAHDFNNRLAAIMNFGHLAIMKLSKDSPARGHVEQILKTTEHAAALAHSLLSLGRGEVVSPMPVNLKATVEGIRELLERTLGEGVKLSTEVEDVMVSAERGRLENVIINLAANARDAMPSGGRLTIEAYRVTFDEDFVKTHGFGAPGQYACLTVSDTGTGMDEKTLQRIFEPFFTTKPAGKGTGLGLAMVYGIIKKYGGFIKCYSEPGSGTTFKIYLPLAEAPADVISKPEPPIEGLGETILLAEDDPEVRSGTKALLEAFGYKVLEASDGEESVELFRRFYEEIALVILDVIMPGLNGVYAYERMRLLKPELKALFLSGYSAGHLSGDALPEGASYFTKPVMPAEFLRKIKQLLGG